MLRWNARHPYPIQEYLLTFPRFSSGRDPDSVHRRFPCYSLLFLIIPDPVKFVLTRSKETRSKLSRLPANWQNSFEYIKTSIKRPRGLKVLWNWHSSIELTGIRLRSRSIVSFPFSLPTVLNFSSIKETKKKEGEEEEEEAGEKKKDHGTIRKVGYGEKIFHLKAVCTFWI